MVGIVPSSSRDAIRFIMQNHLFCCSAQIIAMLSGVWSCDSRCDSLLSPPPLCFHCSMLLRRVVCCQVESAPPSPHTPRAVRSLQARTQCRRRRLYNSGRCLQRPNHPRMALITINGVSDGLLHVELDFLQLMLSFWPPNLGGYAGNVFRGGTFFAIVSRLQRRAEKTIRRVFLDCMSVSH